MIKFRLGTIPVKINPTFWVVAIVLGLPVPDRHRHEMAAYFAGWIVVVLVSVLMHELGHALVARRFGAAVEISLHLMGGHTSWATREPISPWRRVVVAAAGSGVGFALAGTTFGLVRVLDVPIRPPLLASLLSLFVWVNVIWGVFNWLPIRPLDGGHILTGVLQAMFGRRSERVADVIFFVTTAGVGWYAFRNGLTFAAMFCGFLLMEETRHWSRGRPAVPSGGAGLPPAIG